MSIQARLRELHDLLEAFIARPEPGALVVRCNDEEVLYIIHILEQLDAESPADRFFVAPDAFRALDLYPDALNTRIAAELDDPSRIDEILNTDIPQHRVHATITKLVHDLPAGDHRLVCALIPYRIDDVISHAELAESLIATPHPAPLRLIVREDPRRPLSATNNPSDRVLAYIFQLPASAVEDAVARTAMDLDRPPDERGQAILQLAIREIGFGRPDRAIQACDLVSDLARDPALVTLALVTRADALRAAGQLMTAYSVACEALRHAIAARTLPLVYHSAMSLGEVAHHLGQTDQAITCFTLAERSATYSPEAQSVAHRRLLALRSETPC